MNHIEPEVTPSDPADTRRLNVLVVSHLYPHDDISNAGVFVREQVEASSAIVDVTVVVGRYAHAARGVPVPKAGTPGPVVVEVELPWYRRLPSMLRVALAVPRYYREALRAARSSARRFDVIHAHFGFPDGAVGVMLARALSIPVVVTLHGTDFNHQIARPLVGGLLGRWLGRADSIVCVSPHIAEGMRRRFGLPESRVVHIPNGYNDLDIHPHVDRDPRYVLYVGALIPAKNPDLLLRAYATIAHEVQLDLVYVGQGLMRDALETEATDLGIRDRVHFAGQQRHAAVDGYLAEAAVLALPSRSEGMPMVVNEALASGTPVVATRLPGTEQQVRSERFGSLVEVGDERGLAKALLEAIERSWDYEYIARECRVISWSEYAGRLVALYERLVVSEECQ